MALPAATAPAARWLAAESGGAQGGDRGRVRVLIVEDDRDIAEMYRVQLRQDGYMVHLAGDAAEALRSIEEMEPTLILLDVLLPGRDGFSILAEVRERWRTPVVILSNFSDPDMIERGRRLGAREYLVKSRVTPTDISKAIPTWLDRPEP